MTTPCVCAQGAMAPMRQGSNYKLSMGVRPLTFALSLSSSINAKPVHCPNYIHSNV